MNSSMSRPGPDLHMDRSKLELYTPSQDLLSKLNACRSRVDLLLSNSSDFFGLFFSAVSEC